MQKKNKTKKIDTICQWMGYTILPATNQMTQNLKLTCDNNGGGHSKRMYINEASCEKFSLDSFVSQNMPESQANCLLNPYCFWDNSNKTCKSSDFFFQKIKILTYKNN